MGGRGSMSKQSGGVTLSKRQADKIGDINLAVLYNKMTEEQRTAKINEMYKRQFPVEPKEIKDARKEWLASESPVTKELEENGRKQARGMTDEQVKKYIKQYEKTLKQNIEKKNEDNFRSWVMNHLAKEASRSYKVERPMDNFNITYKPRSRKKYELAYKVVKEEAKRRGIKY